MSFEAFLADSQAVRERGDWLAELSVPGPSGTQILRFSRRGTATGAAAITVGSDTIAAHTPFRRRLLLAPTMVQALWASGTLFGRSIPSFGGIELVNEDGGLDAYRPAAGYRWAAGTAKIYFCDAADIQGTIGKVFDGRLAMPEFPVGKPVKVPLLGRDADFEEPTSRRIYRGTNYLLELFGDRTVAYGAPAAVAMTGSFTIEGWLWLDALPTGAVGFWGWFTGTKPWSLIVNATGTLRLDTTIGGVVEQRTTTAAMTALAPYHFSFSVAGAVPTFRLWDEDAQTLTTEVLAAYSSATRDAMAGSAYSLRSASNATFRPWCDEFRVWNVARTEGELEADRHREIPAGSVPASLVHYARFNDGAGTTVVDSSATAANGTISGAGTSAFLWACEGPADLSGTPKQDVWGETYVLATLVDPIRNIYQVAGGGPVKSIVTDEGGVGHIMDTNAASLRTFLTTTPVAGHALTYLARGLSRLGALSPTLPIGARVEGYNGGPLGYVSSAAGISRDLVTRRGLKLADPGALDTASFTAYGAASTGLMGLTLSRPVSIGEALDKVNVGNAGWYGFVRASPLFHVERFAGPAGVADFNFDTRQIIDITPATPVAVIYEVVVRYAYNPQALSAEQVAASLKGTAAWSARTKEWQEERRTDEKLRVDYPGAAGRSFVIETCLQTSAAAGGLADYLLAHLKGLKEGWAVRLRATGLQVKVGQTVTLNYTLRDGTTRAGLDGTKKYAVLSSEDVRQREEVKIDVWG